jgi:outer membrane beta-barrel protein
MRRNFAIATAAALALVFVLSESEAVAQEIVLEGPLVGQPAVRKLMLLRKGRLSVAPNIGFTLVDDFRRNIILGGKLEYNILDWLSIGVWGGYSLGVNTSLTDEIRNKARSNRMNLPRHNHIGAQIGKLNWITTLQINVIPFRGKLALFSKLFLAADIYLFVGGGVAGIEDRQYAADEEAELKFVNALSPAEQDPAFKGVTCYDNAPNDGMADDYAMCLDMESRVTFVPTFGGGITMYVNKWMSLNLEYRAVPFQINKSGTDEIGMNKKGAYFRGKGSASDFPFPNHVVNDDDRLWYLNHSLQISYAFYFNFAGPSVFEPTLTD